MRQDFFSSTIPKEALCLFMSFIIMLTLLSQLAKNDGHGANKAVEATQMPVPVGTIEGKIRQSEHDKAAITAEIEKIKIILLEMEKKTQENRPAATQQSIDLAQAIKVAEDKRTALMAKLAAAKGEFADAQHTAREKKQEELKQQEALKARIHQLNQSLEQNERQIAQLQREFESSEKTVMAAQRGIPIAKGTRKEARFFEIVADRIVPIDEQHYTGATYKYDGKPIIVLTRKSSGEHMHEIGRESSDYKKVLASFNPEKHYLVFILRNGSSFPAFRAARDNALKAHFQVGWEPFMLNDQNKLAFGEGGRIPNVVE